MKSLKQRSVKASVIWPRDVYLLLCELARREGQSFSAWIKSLAAERLRAEALKERRGESPSI